MNGLINLPKVGEVDFVASLTIAVGFVAALLYAFTAGMPGIPA